MNFHSLPSDVDRQGQSLFEARCFPVGLSSTSSSSADSSARENGGNDLYRGLIGLLGLSLRFADSKADIRFGLIFSITRLPGGLRTDVSGCSWGDFVGRFPSTAFWVIAPGLFLRRVLLSVRGFFFWEVAPLLAGDMLALDPGLVGGGVCLGERLWVLALEAVAMMI